MSALPNPWLSDSAAPVSHAADTAVAAISPPVAAAGPTDHIHEIFHHARKLIADDEHRFVLDEVAFAEALEEPPLFLSDAGWPKRTFLR